MLYPYPSFLEFVMSPWSRHVVYLWLCPCPYFLDPSYGQNNGRKREPRNHVKWLQDDGVLGNGRRAFTLGDARLHKEQSGRWIGREKGKGLVVWVFKNIQEGEELRRRMVDKARRRRMIGKDGGEYEPTNCFFNFFI